MDHPIMLGSRKMLAIALQLIGATGAHAAINAHKELREELVSTRDHLYKGVDLAKFN